jgi:hypothetical protein
MGLDVPQPIKRRTIKRVTPRINMRVIVLLTFDFEMIGVMP